LQVIGKESNNLEDKLTGLEDLDYLEYTKDREIVKSNEFTEWILSFKPKDVRDKGISKQTLWNIKERIRKNEILIQSFEGNLQGLSRKEIK